MVTNNLDDGLKQKITQALKSRGLDDKKIGGMVFGADFYYKKPLGSMILLDIIKNLI